MTHCLKCRYARFANIGACTITRKPVEHHEAGQYCPHPDGPKFGASVKPDGFDLVPDSPAMRPPADIPADYDPVRDKDAGRCCS